jgi:hypothetical protein
MKKPVAPQDTVERITAALFEISQKLSAWVPLLRRLAEAEGQRNAARDGDFEISAAGIRSLLAARRLRDLHFWPGMSESAWDILLELFACRLEGHRLTVTALAEATALPLDSTLHWVDSIAAQGFLSRKYADGEHAMVDLTDHGAARMRAYLLTALTLSRWTP